MGGFSLVFGGTWLTQLYNKKQDVLPVQEGHRARFYEHYRKVVECEKKFLKRCSEDLNVMLIFVSTAESFVEHMLMGRHAGILPLSPPRSSFMATLASA